MVESTKVGSLRSKPKARRATHSLFTEREFAPPLAPREDWTLAP